MQGTRFDSLVWENSTCRRATKLVRHHYKPTAIEPVLCKERSHCKEKPAPRN